MFSSVFVVGQTARIVNDIADAAGLAVDPGVLRLRIKDPTGVTNTLTVGAGITKNAVGSYHADVVVSAPGTWFWRWEGDAPNAGAAQGSLVVQRSLV